VVWNIIGDENHCFARILPFEYRDDLLFHKQHKHVAALVVMVVTSMGVGNTQVQYATFQEEKTSS
jgi:hypothetical protein